jgi:ABC-type molybdenum transport system ATPase subunit/photorepair protein PhrA
MDCKISKGTGFIKAVDWLDIPPLAVLTGKNGAGKTRLLSIIAGQNNGSPFNEGCQVDISEKFLHSQITHYPSLWPVQVTSGASSDEVVDAIRTLASGVNSNQRDLSAAMGEDVLRQRLLRQLSEEQGVPIKEMLRSGEVTLQRYVTPSALTSFRDRGSSQVSLAFYFLAYQLLYGVGELNGEPPDHIVERIGPPPWKVLNSILAAAELPYEVDEPWVPDLTEAGLFNRFEYSFRLRDVTSRAVVPPEALSSGEKVLMGTSLWMFNIQHGGQTPKLLLLDEPDAHLHPKMVRQLLNVLQEVFVDKAGIRVILTTHSPTTVAMAPPGSLFELRRGEPAVERITKAKAIGSLTEGLVVVSEGWPLAMCEGPHDPEFYRIALDKVQSALNPAYAIDHMAFMHGCGVTTVQSVVPASRSQGLTHMVGIIDADFPEGRRSNGRSGNDGVAVLKRGAIENYLCDPLVIWFAHRSDSKDIDGVREELIPRGGHARLHRYMPELQQIADDVLGILLKALPDDETRSRELVSVKFIEGVELQYPEWLLCERKEVLLGACRIAFRLLQNNQRPRLRTAFAAIGLTPVDLHEVLRQACGHAMQT